jgi:hypothetical protein
MNLAKEWTAFAGGLFLLMGISLAAAARRNAEDALSWHRQWSAAVGAPELAGNEDARRRRLFLAYRLGGALFAAIGLGLIVSGAAGHLPFAARESRRDALFGGLFFTASGVIFSLNGWLRGGRRAPRFLDGELLDYDAPPPLGERVAAACSRGMIGLSLAFGVRLLFQGLINGR